jgi:site-specific DNA recombinase
VNNDGNAGEALIYCRVSTRQQEEEGTSLDSQEERCREKVAELGYTVARVTREVYTGAELWDRPLLSRDRAHIKEGKFQALVTYSTDRLARNPTHLAIIAEECERAGVELIFVSEPLDASPEGALIRYVKGYAAAVEREKIRERSIRGKQHRVQSGKLLRSGIDRYGYKRVEDGIRREIYEPEAAIVRQIFQWFAAENVSLRQIQRRLNDQDVPTPTLSRRTLPYRGLSGQQWNHSTIRSMLGEPAYKGETVLWRWKQVNGRMVRRPKEEWVQLPDGVSPPIVSAELWDAAQRRLDDRRGRSISRRNEIRPSLLRGLIVCAVCGRPMRPHTNGEGRRSYRCSSREHGGYPCGAKAVPATDTVPIAARSRNEKGRFVPLKTDLSAGVDAQPGIESWVWQHVASVLRDPSIIAKELQHHNAEGPDTVIESDLHTARQALGRIQRQQERLLQQFSQAEDEDFPWALVKEQISRLEREKTRHQSTIDTAEQRLLEQERSKVQLASLTAYCDRVGQNLETFTLEEKRLALEALQVRAMANGRDWSLIGSLPIEDDEARTTSVALERSS